MENRDEGWTLNANIVDCASQICVCGCARNVDTARHSHPQRNPIVAGGRHAGDARTSLPIRKIAIPADNATTSIAAKYHPPAISRRRCRLKNKAACICCNCRSIAWNRPSCALRPGRIGGKSAVSNLLRATTGTRRGQLCPAV